MLPPNTPGGFIPALASELIVWELGGEKCWEEDGGEEEEDEGRVVLFNFISM